MNEIIKKRIETKAVGIGLEFRDAVADKGSNWNVAEAVATLTQTAANWMAGWLLEHLWISVDEALPPIRKVYENEKWSDWVLIRTSKGGVYLDSYIFHRHTWTNNKDNVTHWMPIPELKGGEE